VQERTVFETAPYFIFLNEHFIADEYHASMRRRAVIDNALL
jgi:hypothetical protein